MWLEPMQQEEAEEEKEEEKRAPAVAFLRLLRLLPAARSYQQLAHNVAPTPALSPPHAAKDRKICSKLEILVMTRPLPLCVQCAHLSLYLQFALCQPQFV